MLLTLLVLLNDHILQYALAIWIFIREVSVLLITYFKSFKMTHQTICRPISIVVEGNIGSGKSTFLKKCLTLKDFTVLLEPVDKWTLVAGKHNLLKLMYDFCKDYLFIFQVFTNFTLFQNHLLHVETKFKIQERSILSAKYVFLILTEVRSMLTSIQLDVLFDIISSQEKLTSIDLLVYIKTPPTICLNRIRDRNRDGESSISFKYLKQLHDLHEEWMFSSSVPVLILDGTQSPDEMIETLKDHLTKL